MVSAPVYNISMHSCLLIVSIIIQSLLYSALNCFAQNNSKLHEAAARWGKKDFRYGNDLRCDKASEIGVTRLATVRCPTGLAFDIERQTCDWKTNVKNCDQLESKRTPRLFP